MSSSGRARIWKHYGLFCGLMCCGSCAGAVSHTVWSQFLLALYPGLQDSSIESYLSMASVSTAPSTTRSLFLLPSVCIYVLCRRCVGSQRMPSLTRSRSASLSSQSCSYLTACWIILSLNQRAPFRAGAFFSVFLSPPSLWATWLVSAATSQPPRSFSRRLGHMTALPSPILQRRQCG